MRSRWRGRRQWRRLGKNKGGQDRSRLFVRPGHSGDRRNFSDDRPAQRVSRTDRAVRQAFEAALKGMVDSFEKAATGSTEARRTNALAIAALCVGGMVLSRSIDDQKLGVELREAAKAIALDLGK